MAVQLLNYQAVLGWDASKYQSGMAEAETNFSSFGSKMTELSGGILSGITAAIGAATAALVAFGKEAVTAGGSFDSAMSQVAATMGTTTKDIGEIRATAQELGASTSFSATQAAEGFNVLAMGGLTAKEQIAAIPSVLNLAAAGSIEMSDAAAYATGSIKGFGDSFDNTQYYTDLMAKGATMAATDVKGLGEALSSSSSTAANFGQSAEDTTVALLRLAEQNVTGSAAATAMNRAMYDLYTPTAAAAGALNELGISAYDSQGNAREFNTVVDELNARLAGMSEEEANAYKATIFTSQGLKAFNMMTVSSTDKVQSFRDGLKSASDGIGSAAQQAETMMDNLNGDITIFGSAMEGLQIGVSDNLKGMLRETVQFGTEQITTLTEAVKNEGLTGLAGAVGEVLVNIINKIGGYLPDILNMGIQIVSSLLQGISTSAPTIATTAAEIITTLVTGIISLLPQVIQTAFDVVIAFVNAVSQQIPTLFPVVIQGLLDTIQALLDNLPALLECVLTLILNVAQTITDNIPMIIERLPELIESVLTFLVDATPQIIEAGEKLFTSLITNLPMIIDSIIAVLPRIIQAIVSTTISLCPEIIKAGVSLFTSLITNLPTIIKTICDALPRIINGIIQTLVDNTPQIISAGVDLFVAIIDNIPDILKGIGDAMPLLIQGVCSLIVSYVTTIAKSGQELFEALIDNMPQAIETIKTKCYDIIHAVVTYFRSAVGGIAAAGVTYFTGLTQRKDEIIKTIKKIIPDIMSDCKDYIIEKKDQICEAMPTVITALKDKIVESKDKIKEAVPDLIQAFKDKVSDIKGDMKEAGKWLVEGLWEGMLEVRDWFERMMGGWVDHAINWMLEKFGIASPSKRTKEMGKYLVEGLAVGVNDNTDTMIDAADRLTENTLSQFEQMSDDITAIENGILNTNAHKGVTISAAYQTDKLPNLSGTVNNSFESDSSGFINGLSNVFDKFIARADSLIDNLAAQFDMTGGKKYLGANLNIRMGDISVSGVVDRNAAEQIRDIADEQIDALASQIMTIIPAI